MASILIAGGGGFIGSNLTRTLLNEGHIVYAIDNFSTGKRGNILPFQDNPDYAFFEADISDSQFLTRFKDIDLDYIYHLACPTGVPNLAILAEEMLHACSFGMFNILELARAKNAKLLFTSTAEMYGQPEQFPQHEEYYGNVNPLGPRSCYEEGKRFSESCLATYVRKYGLDARVVRIFNTYGPGMSLDDRRVIPQFIGSIVRSEPLKLFGDGQQTRTHLFVDDLIRGLRLVMDKGIPGEAYNVGGEHPMTVLELAELLIELTNHEAGIIYEPHFIEDHRNRRPAVEKVKALGWTQEITIDIGLQRMLEIHLSSRKVAPIGVTA